MNRGHSDKAASTMKDKRNSARINNIKIHEDEATIFIIR